MHYVFVYGSLMAGEHNDTYLTGAPCFARRCWTNGQLYDTGLNYPALLPNSTSRTYGEVYIVTDEQLTALDELEDFFAPGDERNEYERIVAEIMTEHGTQEAFVYIYCGPALLQPITSGDWRKR